MTAPTTDDEAPDSGALAQSVEAVLDEVCELLADVDLTGCPPEVAQAYALLTAADLVADELLDALNLPDPDEADEAASGRRRPVTRAAPGTLDLVRLLPAMEFRTDTPAAGTLGTMVGHFSVFNSWYEVDSMWEGLFLERVAPGAFTRTIAEDRGLMRVLFDHGMDPQIGNKVLGPIEVLTEDKTGPYYEVPLFDTSYNRDLLPGLRADQYGASFRFRVQEESWVDDPKPSKYNPKAIPERSILRTKTMEFGPVTFPASPAATAGMRSLTDSFYARLRKRDAAAYSAACRAAGRRAPDLTGRFGARSASGGDRTTTKPGSGEVSPEARIRDRVLRMEGILT